MLHESDFFKEQIYLLLFHMYGYSVGMSVCVLCVCVCAVPVEARRGFWIPKTAVTDNHVSARNQT